MVSIREAFVLFWSSIRILWEELWTFAVLNVLWLLLCLPVVTAPASFAALYYVADKAARDEIVTIGDFFAGFKQYLVKGTLLGLLNIVAALILATNIMFYGQVAAGWATYVRIIWIAVAIFWALMQIYLLPMFVVQIEPSIKLTVRNSAMFVLVQPVFTITAVLIVVTLIALSAILIVPFMIISMSLIAVFSCVALDRRLKVLKAKQEAMATEDDPDSSVAPTGIAQ